MAKFKPNFNNEAPFVEPVVKDNNPLNGPNEHEGLPEDPKDLAKLAKAKKEASQPDRSAYNCSACKGEGLQGQVLCSVCNGTGKV